MKNRPKPGTRSYAAGGDHVVKSNSGKDGFGDKKPTEISEEDLKAAQAQLEKAIAENTKLRERITVLETENKGKAEVSDDE